MTFAKKLALGLVIALGAVMGVEAGDVTGTLTPKPEGAAADVVAVLHVKVKKEEKKYNVVASGDVAKQIEEFTKGSKRVKVSGDVDGETLKATAVAEAAAKEKKKKENK